MGTDDSPHVCTGFSPAPASILSSRNGSIRDLSLPIAFHTKYVILSVYKYVYLAVIYLEDADRANFIRNSLQT